jgi:hypothetical protein
MKLRLRLERAMKVPPRQMAVALPMARPHLKVLEAQLQPRQTRAPRMD